VSFEEKEKEVTGHCQAAPGHDSKTGYRMNILWIAPYPMQGRPHQAPWVLMLAKEIVADGHRLTILTSNPNISALQKTESELGFEVVMVPYKGGARHLLSLFNTQIHALEEYLRNNARSFDVIHVHGTELQFASSLVRVGSPVPYIISVQGIISLYKRELKPVFSKTYLYWMLSSFYEKWEIRNTGHFFCRTEWDQAFVRSLNPGADITICWEMLREEFFQYRHPFTGKDILFIGGDNLLKGLGNALEVFDRLLEKNARRDIRLHVVGNVRKKSLHAMLSTLRLRHVNERNLLFHGRLEAPAICGLYSGCFCLYHPSLIDNSPNSICEAQVAGLPVIATRVGGVPSLIQDGFTGILVDKEDLASHVTALDRLSGDRDLQKSLAANARSAALPRHEKDSIVGRTIDTYRKITLTKTAYA
jgi:glycosyltransferase involved in cell wall biosynthesis